MEEVGEGVKDERSSDRGILANGPISVQAQ
jgi:hypothetical protein